MFSGDTVSPLILSLLKVLFLIVPPSDPSKNLSSAVPQSTTSGVEAWIGTRTIMVLSWPMVDQMDVVSMVTLPYYSTCPPSPAKDSQDKNHTQKIKELTFTEKEKQHKTREKFFFCTKKRN